MDKVLIVDDDRIICKCLRELVPWNEIGCLQPMVAHDGISAMEIIEKSRPDIIITDLRMPIMGGVALCEEVHKRYIGIHIIFISAYEDFNAAKIAIKYGVSDYLMKPISKETIENLQSVIKKIQKNRTEQIVKQNTSSLSEAVISMEKNGNEMLVDIIKEIVSDYYHDPNLSVEDIAKRVGFSADYLGKVFVAQTGESVYAYVRDYRISKAAEILRFQNYSVAEIAEKVGYIYPNYFAKIFRNKYGVAPSVYRNKYCRDERGG